MTNDSQERRLKRVRMARRELFSARASVAVAADRLDAAGRRRGFVERLMVIEAELRAMAENLLEAENQSGEQS